MRRFTVGPGDVVVIVPKWAIVLTGLAMLFVGLTGAFSILFSGLAVEGILLAGMVLFAVPLNVLILYIMWRFYWQIMILSFMASALLTCAVVTGTVRVTGSAYSAIMGGRSAAAAAGNSLVAVIVVAALAALLVTIIIGTVLFGALRMFRPSPAPAYDPYTLDRPRPRKRDYPPIDDPYWDDL